MPGNQEIPGPGHFERGGCELSTLSSLCLPYRDDPKS